VTAFDRAMSRATVASGDTWVRIGQNLTKQPALTEGRLFHSNSSKIKLPLAVKLRELFLQLFNLR